MSLLLDSHVVLWWLAGDRRLSARLRGLISTAPVVMVSAASAWEIAIKRSIGKLESPADLAGAVTESGFTPLAITMEHAAVAGGLAPHHHDPFDRMLVAQAMVERLSIVSADARLAAYGVEIIGV